MVQYYWRKYYIDQLKKERTGMIDVVYTSLEANPNLSSHQNQVFMILDTKKYPYRCYDLMTYKALSTLINNFGGVNKLPAIFINDYYIGSLEEFQELEDKKLIDKIIYKEYNDYCLECHISRNDKNDAVCPYCYKRYAFFAKTDEKYDIYKMRK